MSYCTNCKKEIDMMATFCPHCKQDFTHEVILEKASPLKFRAFREVLLAIIIFTGWIYLMDHPLMSTAHHPAYTLGDLFLMILYVPFCFTIGIVASLLKVLTGYAAGKYFFWFLGLLLSYIFSKVLYAFSNEDKYLVRT